MKKVLYSSQRGDIPKGKNSVSVSEGNSPIEEVKRVVPPGLYSTAQHTPSSSVRAARPARGYKGTACRPSAAGLKVRRQRCITPA